MSPSFTTGTEDSHATPVNFSRKRVRFFVGYQIKQHASLLI